jgi:hypothetical protein
MSAVSVAALYLNSEFHPYFTELPALFIVPQPASATQATPHIAPRVRRPIISSEGEAARRRRMA